VQRRINRDGDDEDDDRRQDHADTSTSRRWISRLDRLTERAMR
jgi:hypothetical protein